MIPVSSSGNTSGCQVTTSNCVTWTGPDLQCISLHTGDSVSEVVAALATEICSLIDTLDLSDLDLKCVFESCITCPEPEKTLSTVLNLIINKVCSIDDIVTEIQGGVSSVNSLTNLASCFQYIDTLGDVVTQLPLNEYVVRIGTEVCSLLTSLGTLTLTVNDLSSEVSNLENRVDALEGVESGSLSQVDSACLFTGVKNVDEALSILDTAFCQLRTSTGTPTQLNTAISKQCEGLSTEAALSTSGTLGQIPGWSVSTATVADALTNMWLTICDMRAAVRSILDNCCATTCADVKVGFGITLNVTRNQATIDLTAGYGMSIPSGYSDCGSVMSVSDNSGHVMQFNVTAENNNQATLNLNSLVLTDDFTFTYNYCLSSGSNTCQGVVTKTALAASATTTTTTIGNNSSIRNNGVVDTPFVVVVNGSNDFGSTVSSGGVVYFYYGNFFNATVEVTVMAALPSVATLQSNFFTYSGSINGHVITFTNVNIVGGMLISFT